jgi:hypothetical protein
MCRTFSGNFYIFRDNWKEEDIACTFSKLQMGKFKMIPSLRLPILLREKQTEVFGCTKIKSVLVYK